MSTAADILARYAAYHRDQRNIATHLVGVPMIVLAVGVLLARPAVEVGGWTVTPAWGLLALAAGWWLTRGLLSLGLATTAGAAMLVLIAHRVAGGSTAAWLTFGLATFVLGWLIQFLGHWYEGRKPALADDMSALLAGPMFVAAEALFSAGWNQPLLQEIERRAGPTYLRDLASGAL
jgi:uncharacterized membrane protein YGL010W